MQGLPGYRLKPTKAQIWKRFFAFIIDLSIIDFFILSPLYSKINPDISIKIMALSKDMISIAIFMSALVFFYFFAMEYLLGSTPGKMIFQLRLNKKVSVLQSIIRTLWAIPLFPFPLLWISEPLFLILKKNKLLDIVSKTSIIEDRLVYSTGENHETKKRL